MKKAILVTAVLLIAGAAAPAQQQEEPPATTTVTGSVGVGARGVNNDTDSSKLTEYRDLGNDAYLPGFKLNIFDTRGWYFDFTSANLSLGDQSIWARGGRAGKWSVRFQWMDIPHNLSNKAQTPYIRRGPGLFEVPATVPITFKKLATVAADAPNVRASDDLIATYQSEFLKPTDLATKTTLSRVVAQYAALDAVTLGLAYDVRRKSGLKPAFGPIGDRPPRTLNIQLTEPVDYQTQDVTLTAEHIGKKYQMQFSYLFSDFANRIDTLVWENIYTTAAPDSTFDVWDRAVSVYGRRPLAPDNRYHNLSFSVARDLFAESRLSLTAALGLLRQNENLLPYSFHSDAIANPVLARTRAEAEMNTTQILAEYVINPAARWNVRAWGRHYRMANHTPADSWHYVTSDTSNLNGTVSYKNKRVSLAYASNRTNAGIESGYRWRPWRSNLTVGYERESITRQHRESDTADDRITATFRARPARWANLRARYVFSDRSSNYNPFVTRESYWYELAEATDNDNPRFSFSNHPDMRRFDTSDRRRNQTEFTLTLTPRDILSVAASARYRHDNFDSNVRPTRPLATTGVGDGDATTPGDQLGLLTDRRLRLSLDMFYMPHERASLNTFVSWDRGTNFQRSIEYQENAKLNPSSVALLELGPWTRAGSQWTGSFADHTWTSGLGSTLVLAPNRVILSTTYTLSLSDFDVRYSGFGVTNFDGTPFPPNHQFAFPSRPPTVNQDMHAADVELEFPLVKTSSLFVGYRFERFRTDDWQQGASFPWVEPVGSEFLLRDTSRSHQWGNRLFNLGTFLSPGYNAHIGWISFSYRF